MGVFLKISVFLLSIFLFAIPICTVSVVMEHTCTQFEFAFHNKAGSIIDKDIESRLVSGWRRNGRWRG